MPSRKKGRSGSSQRPRKYFNGFDKACTDILCQILLLLPAKSFAFASCVSKSLYNASRSILSRPKLITALSMEQSPTLAIEEATKEVLSKPIRPQFVIACFTMSYNITIIHDYIKTKFGRSIPIITNSVEGVLGNDVETSNMTEVTVEEVESEDGDMEIMWPSLGLVLIVGWLPDMKVDAIPLICSDYQLSAQRKEVNKFIGDIRRYSIDVAKSPSPAAILMFGDKHIAKKSQLLSKMDEAFAKETAIMGHFNDTLDYSSPNPSTSITPNSESTPEAVALVFARDINKHPEIGNTQFHIPCMRSVSQIGATYSVVSINNIDREKGTTYFDCKLRSMSSPMLEGLDERYYMDDFYVGIEGESTTKKIINRDEASTSASPPLSPKSISLCSIEVDKCNGDESLVVKGEEGIKVGDSFEIYRADFERSLTMDGVMKPQVEVFGGLVFAHMTEKVTYMMRDPLAYSSPFINQFEDVVPLGGLFTKYVVKRGSVATAWKDGQQQQVAQCKKGHKGIAYLVMSFAPPPALPPPPPPLPPPPPPPKRQLRPRKKKIN